MRAELAKVRALPTPAWCLGVVAACGLLGVAATWQWGPGSDLLAVEIALGFPLAIASIVFGVWIFGVEYGQGTLRRTLSADPRRLRLFLSKLVVALLLVAVATALLHLALFPFFDLAADRHGETVAVREYLDLVYAALLSNVVYATVGASLALITASMAGGVTAALVFVFIIDIVLGVIPEVGDFSFGIALADVVLGIRGTESGIGEFDSGHTTAQAAAILAAWLAGLTGLGWLRLWRRDVR
jgi:ABC-2 type transport system permease protein